MTVPCSPNLQYIVTTSLGAFGPFSSEVAAKQWVTKHYREGDYYNVLSLTNPGQLINYRRKVRV